jgi:peroxiredoxin
MALLSLGSQSVASDPKADLAELVSKINTRLQAGKLTERDLTEEFAAFDILVTRYKKERPEEAAEILSTKALLLAEAFGNDEKAILLLKQVETDFPNTTASQKAKAALAAFAAQAKVKEVAHRLAVGTHFPDFDEKDMEGHTLSVSKFKGKVVLIDFWDITCDLCVDEMARIRKLYKILHEKGFEVIGISLDLEREKFSAFLKKEDVNWPQYFDGKGWRSKLVLKYGVTSMPSTYLLDRQGDIIAKDLTGAALEAAIERAISVK